MSKGHLVLMAAIALGGVLVACGGGGSPPDLTPVRDALPLYPGASVVQQNAPPRPITSTNPKQFLYDRLYLVGGLATQEDITNGMKTALGQAGWQQEEPTKSQSKEIRRYCELVWVQCESFLKEGVRVVVSVPLPLSLNPAAPQGANYHTHLEQA